MVWIIFTVLLLGNMKEFTYIMSYRTLLSQLIKWSKAEWNWFTPHIYYWELHMLHLCIVHRHAGYFFFVLNTKLTLTLYLRINIQKLYFDFSFCLFTASFIDWNSFNSSYLSNVWKVKWNQSRVCFMSDSIYEKFVNVDRCCFSFFFFNIIIMLLADKCAMFISLIIE